MPRTKSRSSRQAGTSRRDRASRSQESRVVVRTEEVLKIRRYLDFVRAVVGPATRNGR